MNNTARKPFVFVLMPFHKDFDDIYHLGIKAACDDAGAYCERVDEQIYEETILQQIHVQISKADIIVADMSGQNPNVFYETGYAHALGKKVILLTQATENIPFDLKHYLHIVYGGRIKDLKADLAKRIRWCIENEDSEPYREAEKKSAAGKYWEAAESYLRLSQQAGSKGDLETQAFLLKKTVIEYKNGSYSWEAAGRLKDIAVIFGSLDKTDKRIESLISAAETYATSRECWEAAQTYRTIAEEYAALADIKSAKVYYLLAREQYNAGDYDNHVIKCDKVISDMEEYQDRNKPETPVEES